MFTRSSVIDSGDGSTNPPHTTNAESPTSKYALSYSLWSVSQVRSRFWFGLRLHRGFPTRPHPVVVTTSQMTCPPCLRSVLSTPFTWEPREVPPVRAEPRLEEIYLIWQRWTAVRPGANFKTCCWGPVRCLNHVFGSNSSALCGIRIGKKHWFSIEKFTLLAMTFAFVRRSLNIAAWHWIEPTPCDLF